MDPLEFVDGPSLYPGYFVPGGMDPSGELTIRATDTNCPGCGKAAMRWNLKMDKLNERYLVQKICWSIEVHVCEKKDGCCVPKETKSGNKCVYEVLIKPGEGKFNANDLWRLPYLPLKDTQCEQKGGGAINAEIRTFDLKSGPAISKENWIPNGSVNVGEDFSVNVIDYIDGGKEPAWWQQFTSRAFSGMVAAWDCCDTTRWVGDYEWRSPKSFLVHWTTSPFAIGFSPCGDPIKGDPREGWPEW